VPWMTQEVAIVSQLAITQLIVCIEAPGVDRPRARGHQAVVRPACYLQQSRKAPVLLWIVNPESAFHIARSRRADQDGVRDAQGIAQSSRRPEPTTPYLPRHDINTCLLILSFAAALLFPKVMDRCMPKGHLDGVCDTGHRAGRCPVLDAP
jgi:hypothetical protein